MNPKITATPSPFLKHIISVYADLWADIMLGKNLESNLGKIEDDIVYLDQLALKKEKNGEDNQQLIKIANQLYCLKLIIVKKLRFRAS